MTQQRLSSLSYQEGAEVAELKRSYLLRGARAVWPVLGNACRVQTPLLSLISAKAGSSPQGWGDQGSLVLITEGLRSLDLRGVYEF